MDNVAARPHPGVDSFAPARSALLAFASGKFLAPFPKRLKSPPGEGESLAVFLKCCVAAMAGAALSKQSAAKGDSLSACPSPVGTGEGGKAG